MSLCQKYLVRLSKWRIWLARCLGGCIFSCSRGSCMFFFNIVFDIVWANYKFGVCIKTWRRGFGCLRLSFTSQRESQSVPDRDFLATLLLILSHFELLRIELPKSTPSILWEIETILVVLVDQFYTPAHKALAF